MRYGNTSFQNNAEYINVQHMVAKYTMNLGCLTDVITQIRFQKTYGEFDVIVIWNTRALSDHCALMDIWLNYNAMPLHHTMHNNNHHAHYFLPIEREQKQFCETHDLITYCCRGKW